MRTPVGVVIAAALFFASACTEEQGFFEGATLEVVGCAGDGGTRVFEPFRLSFTFFAFDRERGLLFVRGQTHGEPPTGADGLGLVIEDETALRALLQEDGPTELPLGGEDALVRGALVLADTCPRSFASLVLRGGVARFHRLGRGPGDRVRISLHDVEVVDMRDESTVGTGFFGEFDFVIGGRRPFRPFER